MTDDATYVLVEHPGVTIKSNKIEQRNPSATAAGAEGDVVRDYDYDSLSEGELSAIVGGLSKGKEEKRKSSF
ncbi:hypothetical protein [Kamptonema formosum]|uniref:hypothetical protein n=1 Tax=Kamptonema formosum TaxID=331992 RepID=UPI00037B7D6C|nr:hypothetical protein [Oscillatoria sp. PCC 10802]